MGNAALNAAAGQRGHRSKRASVAGDGAAVTSTFLSFIESHENFHGFLNTLPVDQLASIARCFCQPIESALDMQLEVRCKPPAMTLDLMARKFNSASKWEQKEEAIRETTKWVVENIMFASSSDVLKSRIRQVVCDFNYCLSLTDAQCFVPLREACEQHLRTLGAYLHLQQFIRGNLRTILGAFKPHVADPAQAHQLVPPFCKIPDGLSPEQVIVEQVNVEATYIHFLRILALAMTKAFENSVNHLLSPLLAESRVSTHGIKGFARMYEKMLSAADHATRPFPRPQFNVDVVRCLATFNTAEEMMAAQRRIESHFGGFVKYKNGMAWDDDTAAERFHLRTMLANVSFRHPILSTIGRLRDNDEIKRTVFDRYLDTQPIDAGFPPRIWERHVNEALRWIAEWPADTPISMVCEVQSVLRSYRDIRHRMHEAYRIVRSPNETTLYAGFKKFGRAFRMVSFAFSWPRTVRLLLSAVSNSCVACMSRLPNSRSTVTHRSAWPVGMEPTRSFRSWYLIHTTRKTTRRR